VYKLKEKCQKIESDHVTQISTIEKQIININKKIVLQEKAADSVAKKDYNEYIELWDHQLNNIIRNIDSVKFLLLFLKLVLGIFFEFRFVKLIILYASI